MEDQNQSRGQKELQEMVQKAHLCTGCGACVGLCPYQVIYNDQTIVLHPCDLKEGRCYAFCPRTPTDYGGLKKYLFDEADLTPELGAMKGFYVTRAADGQVRNQSQHGGTVTALMSLALQEGIIDTDLDQQRLAFEPSKMLHKVVSSTYTLIFRKSTMVEKRGSLKRYGRLEFNHQGDF